MTKNNGISMISLIVTIVLIIILASITSFYLSSTLDDVQYKDAKEELKNVENVVEYAKTQILTNEFIPNEAYLVKATELENKFGRILTDEEIEHIKVVNSSTSIKAPHKYYLMNQTKFDSEFGNDYNVSDLRNAREYIVNYMDTYVISSYEGERLANVSDITFGEDDDDDKQAEIAVAYNPNGNIEWAKQQATIVSVKASASATVESIKYLWSQSYTKPNTDEFALTLTDGQTIDLENKTGNDWYLWICVTYKENGVTKTYITKSEPFYLDNTAPTADLDVEEIDR